jgi:hypothetical protein
MVRIVLCLLVGLVLGVLAFADDAQAFGHGRRAGCSSVAAEASCSGYGSWDLFGFHRRAERRAARRAARHAAYGCSGEVATCGFAAASCSAPAAVIIEEPAPTVVE